MQLWLWNFDITLGLQPAFQIFREKRMVPIPPTLLIERRQQQLALLHRGQHAVTRGCSGYSFAQRSRKPVEYGRAQHEQNHFVQKTAEHLGEISANWTLRAGKIAHVSDEVLSRPRRGGDNPQGGRPTFRLPMQKVHLGGSQDAKVLVFEKGLRFLRIKAQRRGIKLQQLVPRA